MKIDRMIGILAVLLQREKVTAPYLAEKFEVSRRTISRDIENLCRAGIPIRTEQGAGGGISIMEGYKMDRTLLTRSDMQAILEGLRSLDSVSGTSRYAQLMERLSAGAEALTPGGQHILIDLSAWSKSALAPKIELLRGAIEDGRQVRFRYFSPKGESRRLMEPYDLVFRWASWYVWGYCMEREDYRLFKLNRMTEMEAGDFFAKRQAPLPDLSNERVFPPLCRVKALIAPEYRWRLVEDYGPDCFAVQADGRLLFTFAFSDEDSILSWILSFREGAELLEPAYLRERLAALGETLYERYREK